jgi:hypothetical protein
MEDFGQAAIHYNKDDVGVVINKDMLLTLV